MLPLALLLALFHAADVASALPSRWGHTLSLVDRSLLVASGKVDISGQTYTSASTTSTSLLLPLSAAFTLANADSLVQQLEGGGPPYAWGSAETIGDGTSRVLGFGGDGSPGTAIQTGSDSAWIYSSSDGWVQEESGWASQPMRREGGASCTLDDTSYFTAGFKADGSVTAILTTYSYTADGGFVLHPSKLPVGLLQPTLHCLTNGTLLLFGGYSTSSSSVSPLSSAYTLDTTQASAEWTTIELTGDVPVGRRAALGVTLGSGNGLFLAGGGTGQNGLENVLDDAYILSFETGSWESVTPSGTGPGGRLGAQGVAIGNSQVLFFGGYGTSSAADGNLYLYDLATNSYLDTFSPPSTWTTSASSASSSSSPAAQAIIPSNAIASQTTLLSFTQTLSFQSFYPTVVTDAQGVVATSTVTSDVLTSIVVGTTLATIYEVTLSSGETSTVYPSAIGAVSAAGGSTSDESWDPATWTGVVPGYATLTTSGRSSSTGTAGAEGSSSGNASGGSIALSSKEKAAIGVGTVLGVLALAAGALIVLVRRRKRSRDDMDDENEKSGLAGPRSRDMSENSGTWTSAFGGGGNLWDDFTGRDRKRTKLYGRLSEKFAGFRAVAGGGPVVDGLRDRDGAANRRWGMLDDEDTRSFETYPPRSRQVSATRTIETDGEESPTANAFTDAHSAGQAGMGIFTKSSSFAPTPEDYGSEDRVGDLGYGRLDDDDNDAIDPFSDDVVAASGLKAGSMKRSAATNNFYPNARPYSEGISSDASHPSFESQRSSNVAHAYIAPASTSVFPPPPPFSSTIYPQAAPSRSNSNAGWRKVLGINVRAKSPPPPSNLTNLPPSVLVMGSRMRDLRDPATPPVLGFDEDLEKGQWSGQRRRTSYGKLGHGKGQDASMSSLASARTATSEQFDRFNHLDIIQRNRTSSGSTQDTPESSPVLETAAHYFAVPAISSQERESLRNPFEDSSQDLIALSPETSSDGHAFSRPSTRPSGGRPLSSAGTASPSLSIPSSTTHTTSSVYSRPSAPATPVSLDLLSPKPDLPLPAAPPPVRRSVKDAVAAFEQQTSTTEPLKQPGRTKKISTSYATVARPTLTLANPDARAREASD